MMPYWMRIAIGAVLGLVALLALWPTLGITWLTATVAALLAPVGFLASYFIWSADRPDEGYEQVLFDKPNTIVTLAMILVFAGAGLGTGFLGGESAPTPADRVAALRNQYQGTSDAITAGDLAGEDATAAIAALREESDRIAVELETLEETDANKKLIEANDDLAFAMDALKECAGGDRGKCVDARVSAADAQSALNEYADLQ